MDYTEDRGKNVTTTDPNGSSRKLPRSFAQDSRATSCPGPRSENPTAAATASTEQVGALSNADKAGSTSAIFISSHAVSRGSSLLNLVVYDTGRVTAYSETDPLLANEIGFIPTAQGDGRSDCGRAPAARNYLLCSEVSYRTPSSN